MSNSLAEIREEMVSYDKLPISLRYFIGQSNLNLDPQDIYRKYLAFGYDEKRTIAWLKSVKFA